MGFGRERLDLAPSPTNIRYAEKLRAEILGKIERGTFALGDYFPDSPRAKTDAQSTTFDELFTEWLSIKAPTVQHSTAHHYRQTVTSHHFDSIRSKRVSALDYRTLMSVQASLPTHPKTFNNIATVLKQVLTYAFRAKLMREPLHEHVVMRKTQPPGPDPFSLDEIEVVLANMPTARAKTYFEFEFFSGLRPSEAIALRWSRVDLARGIVRVDVALTRGMEKGTKTNRERAIELTSRAKAALERQLTWKTGEDSRVFSSDEGKAFDDTDDPLNPWWKPALTQSGLRYRDARQTRHTFATICLMAGNTPAWVAQQLGHTPEMFFRAYSRWISGADKGVERNRLDAFLGAGLATAAAKAGTSTGTEAPKTA